MNLIRGWPNKRLRCHFCGETRSVKYTVKVRSSIAEGEYIEVPACNNCVLMHIDKTAKCATTNKSNI